MEPSESPRPAESGPGPGPGPAEPPLKPLREPLPPAVLARIERNRQRALLLRQARLAHTAPLTADGECWGGFWRVISSFIN